MTDPAPNMLVKQASDGLTSINEVAVEVIPASTLAKRQSTSKWKMTLDTDTEIHNRADERRQNIVKGHRFFHDQHGEGTVTMKTSSGSITIQFESGMEGTYELESLRHLWPVIEDAHTYTPDMLFSMVDSDSTGDIDKAEFRFLHKMIIDAHSVHTEKMVKAQHEEERQRHSAAQLRKFLWAALVTIVILLAGMSGLMAAVVAAFKDTKADGPVLANNEGMVMETSLASINLPLVAAPAMDLQRLAQVSSVSVTLYVMNGTMPPFLKASVFAKQVGDGSADVATVERLYTVTTATKLSPTSVLFETSMPNQAVLIADGVAKLVVVENGALVWSGKLCASNVDCAAITVDSDEAEQLSTKAKTELDAKQSRRQLQAAAAAVSCFNPGGDKSKWVDDFLDQFECDCLAGVVEGYKETCVDGNCEDTMFCADACDVVCPDWKAANCPAAGRRLAASAAGRRLGGCPCGGKGR
uniref:EF-hand domain-containing protein n=1 Tax=Phaeocystis antarctica TaxID=33657 RepID=A0A7S0E4Z8_9EUKA